MECANFLSNVTICVTRFLYNLASFVLKIYQIINFEKIK